MVKFSAKLSHLRYSMYLYKYRKSGNLPFTLWCYLVLLNEWLFHGNLLDTYSLICIIHCFSPCSTLVAGVQRFSSLSYLYLYI